MGIASLITADLRRQDATKRRKINAGIEEARIRNKDAANVANIHKDTSITTEGIRQAGRTYRTKLAEAGDVVVEGMRQKGDTNRESTRNTAYGERQDSINRTALRRQGMIGDQKIDQIETDAYEEDRLQSAAFSREHNARLDILRQLPQMDANDYNYNPVALPPGMNKKKKDDNNVLIIP